MLELGRTPVAVVAAFASPEALDALSPAGAYRCRVAPDEAMFVGPADAAAALVRDASAVTAGDPDAVVLDATDGWTALTLSGDEAREAFSHLSELELPKEGYVQGDVAHVPVRVIAAPGRLRLFVPAMWGEYLIERILGLGRDIAEVAP